MSDVGIVRRVVVAHGEAAIRDSAMAVARVAGFEVVGVADGESARALLHSQPVPAALVVDVALPGVLGYELCEEIATLGLRTKVILVASVYSRTAYKRRPSSLYGASDYVEQHHIIDQLGPKLENAVEDSDDEEFAMHRRKMTETGEHKAVKIREAGEGRLAFRYADHSEGVERARSLARLLVADMLLYSGDLVEEWVAAGALGDHPVDLEADITEARHLFQLRVPDEIAEVRDFVGDAVREVLHGIGSHPSEDPT